MGPAQLGAFGCKLGLACATWSCIKHLVLKLGPRQAPNGLARTIESANLAPAGRSLGRAAQLGRDQTALSWAQPEPMLENGSIRAGVGPKFIWTLLRQLRAKLGPTETQHWEHRPMRSTSIQKNAGNTSEIGALRISYGLARWISTWAEVAPKRSNFRPRKCWSQVTSGPTLGGSWAKMDPKFGQCCEHVGSKRCFADLGPICQMCK